MVFGMLEAAKKDLLQHDHDVYRQALIKIATGDGYYGMQAREYKYIAKDALNKALIGGTPK